MPDEPRRPLTPSGPPQGGDHEIIYRKPPNWFRRHLSGVLATAVVLVLVGGITGAVLATRNVGDVAVSQPSLIPSSAAPFASVAPPPSTAPATGAVPTGPVKTTASGTVVAVLGTGKWTVDFEKGLELTVAANSDTKYAQKKTAADVVKGVTITVVGTIAGGVITAKTITVAKLGKSAT